LRVKTVFCKVIFVTAYWLSVKGWSAAHALYFLTLEARGHTLHQSAVRFRTAGSSLFDSGLWKTSQSVSLPTADCGSPVCGRVDEVASCWAFLCWDTDIDWCLTGTDHSGV